MKIWIEDKIGYIDCYSLMEQPDQIEVDLNVEAKDFDFANWRYDGNTLIHDPEHAPEPDPIPPSDLELLKQQNAKLTLLLTETTQKLDQGNTIVAKLMLQVEELNKKVGGE